LIDRAPVGEAMQGYNLRCIPAAIHIRFS